MLKLKGYISHDLAKKLNNESYKVIGLFSSGIYLENSSNNYLMLHDINYGLIPFGIGIKNYKEIFSSLKLEDDSIFIIQNNCLLVKDILSIELETTEYKTCNNSLKRNEFTEYASKEVLNSNKGIFSKLINDINEENIYTKKINDYILGKKKIDKENYVDFLKEIIGLGPGLTPSGDDFLTGYLYVKMINEDSLTSLMIDYIKKNSKKLTNLFSNIYLNSVLNGERFSLYEDVIYANDIDELKLAISRLLEVGNNSGSDILCGMIYANRN